MIAEQLEQSVTATPEGSPPSGSFGDRLRRFVAMEHRRRELEAELKDISGRSDELSKLLLDDFADAGMKHASVDGLTVYVRIDRYVSKRGDVETQAICDLLPELGRGDMVKDGYNAASLKSWVLEQLATRKELQDEINGGNKSTELEERLAEVDRIQPLLSLLNVGEVPRIVTTKS